MVEEVESPLLVQEARIGRQTKELDLNCGLVHMGTHNAWNKEHLKGETLLLKISIIIFLNVKANIQGATINKGRYNPNHSHNRWTWFPTSWRKNKLETRQTSVPSVW